MTYSTSATLDGQSSDYRWLCLYFIWSSYPRYSFGPSDVFDLDINDKMEKISSQLRLFADDLPVRIIKTEQDAFLL